MAAALSGRVWGLSLLRTQRAQRVSAQKRRRVLLSAFLLGLCVVSLALVHVRLRLQVVHLGYVLSTLTKLQSQLEQENRELKVELATLSSPKHLEAAARRRLGLMEPEKGQVVVLP